MSIDSTVESYPVYQGTDREFLTELYNCRLPGVVADLTEKGLKSDQVRRFNGVLDDKGSVIGTRYYLDSPWDREVRDAFTRMNYAVNFLNAHLPLQDCMPNLRRHRLHQALQKDAFNGSLVRIVNLEGIGYSENGIDEDGKRQYKVLFNSTGTPEIKDPFFVPVSSAAIAHRLSHHEFIAFTIFNKDYTRWIYSPGFSENKFDADLYPVMTAAEEVLNHHVIRPKEPLNF